MRTNHQTTDAEHELALAPILRAGKIAVPPRRRAHKEMTPLLTLDLRLSADEQGQTDEGHGRFKCSVWPTSERFQFFPNILKYTFVHLINDSF